MTERKEPEFDEGVALIFGLLLAAVVVAAVVFVSILRS